MKKLDLSSEQVDVLCEQLPKEHVQSVVQYPAVNSKNINIQDEQHITALVDLWPYHGTD